MGAGAGGEVGHARRRRPVGLRGHAGQPLGAAGLLAVSARSLDAGGGSGAETVVEGLVTLLLLPSCLSPPSFAILRRVGVSPLCPPCEARASRCGSLAQLVEQLTLNQRATGS